MFSSYERMFVSLTLRIGLLIGQNMGNLISKTTLWSDCPLGIVRKERRIRAFNACVILFQKAFY